MYRILICLVIVIIAGLFAPGCTIHFKGENLELDAERQRVYKFDGITWSKTSSISGRGPAKLFYVDHVGFSDHKLK